MIKSVYKYRLRDKNATWGIAIDLDITFDKISDNKNNIAYNYEDSVFILGEEKVMIEKALLYLTTQDTTGDSFRFLIKKVAFNDCDFQKEGLFFAVILWAQNYFSFKAPSNNYVFDKKNNIYLFDFFED